MFFSRNIDRNAFIDKMCHMRFQKRPYGKEDHDALRSLSFFFGGKIWVYASSTEQTITFKIAENVGNNPQYIFLRWYKAFGLKRAQVARRLNISQSYLSKIENGKRKPPEALLDWMTSSIRDRDEAEKLASKRILQESVRRQLNEV